jgi:hypothetical protein
VNVFKVPISCEASGIKVTVVFMLVTTEHGDRVVTTPASYSGGPRFKYHPGGGFRGFPQSFHVNARIVGLP